MPTTAGIILASGYGALNGRPKVVEPIGDRPMIIRCVASAITARLSPVVIVVNALNREEIQSVVTSYFRSKRICFALQPERTGAADATLRGLAKLNGKRTGDFAIIFGDMPLWRAETIRQVVDLRARKQATVAMATVSLDSPHPKEVERFGRVIRDGDGLISRIVEPAEAVPEELRATTVNPSLYAFETDWFERHALLPAPHVRHDGYPAEHYLPPLVGLAVSQWLRIAEHTLCDPEEALGVNTPEELARVRATWETKRTPS